MDKKTEDFLNTHFKAGDYYSLTLLLEEEKTNDVINILKSFDLTLAIMPTEVKEFKCKNYQTIIILVKIVDIDIFKEKMDANNMNITKQLVKH